MGKRKYDDFNVHADDYRKVHSENISITGADSFYFARQKAQRIAGIEKTQQLQMLDWGCGDGVLSSYLEKLFPTATIYGADVSVQSIAKAKSLPTTVNFIHLQDDHLSFDDNHFDVVVVAAVLHHIDFSHHEKWLQEIYRVMKPGGRVYVFEHNPFNPATRYIVQTCIFDQDARLLKPSYARQLFMRSGFKKVQIQHTLFFPRLFLKEMFDFLEKGLWWLPLGGQYMLTAKK